jgi:putative ABC transport system permease protein
MVGEGAWLALIGIVIGMVGASVATRALQSQLFETSSVDPLAFAAAPVLLGVAALLASYLPARKAASVAPLVALGR